MAFFKKLDLKKLEQDIKRVGKGLEAASKGGDLEKVGKDVGRFLQGVAKEPARIVKDLQDVDVEVFTNVSIDLSAILDTEKWIAVAYKDHVIHARSELGKLISEGLKGEIRKAISKALKNCVGGLRSKLPDISRELLKQIPSDAPFHTEMTETLQEYATSSAWTALFESDDKLLVSSTFTLDGLLDSLINKVMRRDQLHRDLMDLAAKQGHFSGNLFDLFPDLRGQFLKAIEDKCFGMRRPLQASMDFYSNQVHWDARIPSRNKVNITSKFTLQDLIDHTCQQISEDDISHSKACIKEMYPMQGMLIDVMPASGLMMMAPAILAALVPGMLAKQPPQIACSHEFVGPVVVDLRYPKKPTEVFHFEVQVEFQRVVRQIVVSLLKGLPRSVSFSHDQAGLAEVCLDYPEAGESGFSARLLLKEKQLHTIIEGAVEQNRSQIETAIPVRVARFLTSTASKSSNESRWECVNKIGLNLKVVG